MKRLTIKSIIDKQKQMFSFIALTELWSYWQHPVSTGPGPCLMSGLDLQCNTGHLDDITLKVGSDSLVQNIFLSNI